MPSFLNKMNWKITKTTLWTNKNSLKKDKILIKTRIQVSYKIQILPLKTT